MTASKILFYFCLSLIFGIFLESVFEIPQFILWIFLFLAICLISLSLFAFSQISIRFVDSHYVLIFGFCVLFLVLGILRTQISEFNVQNDKLSKLNDSGEEIVLEGTIVKEPDLRDSSQKIKVKIDGYGSVVLATTGRYPEYQYLDRVKITGKLQTPMETEDFSYKNYLLKDHIYSVMYFPKISAQGGLASGGESDKINPNIAQKIYSRVLWLKGKMRESIKNNFSPPESSVLQGIILGDKSAIPQDVKDKFRITGLSHIIAVSGMHVVILVSIIMFFLLFVGLWRGQVFYGAVIFILIYVVLVGAPSSAVRAGIMGGLYLLAKNIGRQTISIRIIVLAASFMLLFNPLLLFYDVGFQLSFLAVLGLIYLEPIIRNFVKILIKIFFKKQTKEKYENGLMIFSATMAAQIFTLPVIIYNFGNISFVSPLTNVLVLPIVPAIMFFGFLSSLAGIIFPWLGWLISLPGYFLLEYFFLVVDVFSKPWAYKIIENVSWIWVAVSYIFISFFTRYFYKKLSTKFLDY